jgi:DNA repair protein RecO (recombination protein O)
MLQKDEGVILKTARSGESSRLVTFLGREAGKTRLLAKGAMSPKSPFRGALEPGGRLEVVYYHKEDRTLYFLKEVNVRSQLESGRESLERMATALAVLELLDRVCFWESPEPRIVDLLFEYLETPGVADPVFFFLAFEWRLLAVLGASPELSVCAVCGGAADEGYYHPEDGLAACPAHARTESHRVKLDADLISLVASLDEAALGDLAPAVVSPEARKGLGAVIHWTYTFHVNNYRLPESLKLIPKG